MCGIAGIFFYNQQKCKNSYADMAKAIKYRGRDGQGRYEKNGVFLYHQRLSIIDLAGGMQPIIGNEGEVLIANGEIYNYRALKAQCSDYPFKTNSDSELLIALYQRYGCHLMEHVRGMISFALYDPKRDTLLIGRDMFGIKPLYIQETADYIAFSSSLDSFLAPSLPQPTLNEQAFGAILQYQYSGGTQTIYNECKRATPGIIYSYHRDKNTHQTHYYYYNNVPSYPDNIADITAQLDAHLQDSLHHHTIADVPIGLFLSGGIDSSVILASLEQADRLPEICLSAAVSGKDEAGYAKKLSKYYNIEHTIIPFSAHDIPTLLHENMFAWDDPICDYALFPTLKLASHVPKHIKVILTGEGGDELFAGYGRYRKFIKNDKRQTYPFHPFNNACQYQQMRDIVSYLPDNLLLKTDRALMAYHLEGRVPLLDTALAAWAYHLPQQYKIQGKHGKYILQKYLQQKCPPAHVFAKKRGFSVPIERWIKTLAMPDKSAMLKSDFLATISPNNAKLWKKDDKKNNINLFRLWFLHHWYQHRFA